MLNFILIFRPKCSLIRVHVASIWFVMGVVCYLLDIPAKLHSLTLKNAYNVVYIMINESESLQKQIDAINELLTSSGERENVDGFEYFQDREQETKIMIDDVVQKDYIDKKSLYSLSRFIIDEIIKREKSEYFQSNPMKAVRSIFFIHL